MLGNYYPFIYSPKYDPNINEHSYINYIDINMKQIKKLNFILEMIKNK